MPILDWTRTDLSFSLPNRSQALRFDMIDFATYDVFILKRDGAVKDYSEEILVKAGDRIHDLNDEDVLRLEKNIIAGLPGGEGSYDRSGLSQMLSTFDVIDKNSYQRNLHEFLESIIPVAEESGVRMAIHPDDPPFPLFGIPRVVSTSDDLETICQNFGGENIAACIVEPIAGSTGTLVPPKGYLQKLRDTCDKHGILLIFDEVITGWGRTGSSFASIEYGVTPDIMTMAKATTNGVVPMGVVACKDEIYDSVMDASPMGSVELFHGYTYSGIPVAVAAALAVQDIFEKEDIFERAKNLAPYFQKGLFSLQDLESVENIRGYGMMGGIDMKLNTKPGKAGYETFKSCYEAGVNFKATGDCLIIAPQFICEKKHIDEIIDKLRTGITNYQKNQKN